jgi:sugar phosphate isomerase/epimerase
MKVSVQIYSIRESGDLDHQLALVRQTGYDWVESVATHGLGATEFAARLAQHGLKLSSMHVGLALLESASERERVVEACRLTGCRLVVMPWLPMGERPATGAGWQALGRRLAGLSATLRAALPELRLAYHNHEWEFLAYDGRLALEWIFSAATPAELGWEADLGWVRRAGADPLGWATQHAERLVCVHAKDIAAPGTAVAEDGWATLGQGIVGWAALLAALKPRVDLFVYEHDKPTDFAGTLRASRQFLREHLGA